MKVITGTLENVEFTDKQVKVTIKEPGKGGAPDGGRWPASFSGFLDQVDEQIQVALQEAEVGEHWSITVEESTKLNSKGNPYLNLVSATPGTTGTHVTPEFRPTQPPPDPVDQEWDNMSRPTATQPGLTGNDRPLLHDEDFRDPRSGPERPNADLAVDGIVRGHYEKLAVNLYNAERDISEPVDWVRIRLLRDEGIRFMLHTPILSERGCYIHNVDRKESTTRPGFYFHQHMVDDQRVFCTEEGFMDGSGRPLNPSQPETEEE